jgi:hypothetical protein
MRGFIQELVWKGYQWIHLRYLLKTGRELLAKTALGMGVALSLIRVFGISSGGLAETADLAHKYHNSVDTDLVLDQKRGILKVAWMPNFLLPPLRRLPCIVSTTPHKNLTQTSIDICIAIDSTSCLP